MLTLETFLSDMVFGFFLIFVRLGTALMIMPGLGDSFVPQNIRLFMALGLSFVMLPLTLPFVPSPVPGMNMMLSLIFMEFVIGLLIGTVARILMTALDTAGMIIASTSGLANAQVFNPSMAAQGSVVGAFLSVTGVLFIFATNLHHMLIYGLVESYQMFPIGGIPDSGSMADLISRTVSISFKTGLLMAIPFIVLTLMVNILMGVLSRLMPQLQVFILVLPVQIILTLLVLSLTLSSMYLFWATQFQDGITFFYQSAGK